MSERRKEIVIWQENFFRRTMDIYEPRGPKYHCTQCNEVLNTRLSIFTHSKMHLKPFCIVCGLYTQNLDQMQTHMRTAHRALVDIIPVVHSILKDENQNETTHLIDDQKDALVGGSIIKKPRTQSAKRTHKTVHARSDKQHLVSRFGRCINVKIPADF